MNMKYQPSQRISQVNEYYFSTKLREIDQMRAAGKEIINLGIGSPDMMPHPDVIAELANFSSRNDTHGYAPYKGIPDFRQGIAGFYRQHYGVTLDPDTEILPMMGSKEGIMHLSMALLDPGDVVLVPNPGYPSYAAAANIAGAMPVYYNLTEEGHWQPDFDELAIIAKQKPKMMWINYPHMPTGATAAEGMFERLVAFAQEHGILICHDNPYSFILNDQPVSLLSIPGAKSCAVELNSLSKSHNMAGWRVGMMCGQAEVLALALRFKSNMDSGMYIPVQRAAIKAMSLPAEWNTEINQEYRARRIILEDILQFLDVAFDPGQSGMFLWGKVPEGETGYTLSDRCLYEAGVFLTPGGIFGSAGTNYIRGSLCQKQSVLKHSLNKLQSSLSSIKSR